MCWFGLWLRGEWGGGDLEKGEWKNICEHFVS